MVEDPKSACLRDAREVLRLARTASLAVLDTETGGPFGSLVNLAVTGAFAPILLISGLARHTQCLERDGQASIMVHDAPPAEGDALTALRATVTGRFGRTDEASVRAAYLRHHPYAEQYAGFGDFGFWVMAPAKLYVVGGFGRIFSYDAQVLTAG